jgi:PTS system mannose-specific IIC component
VTAAAQLLPLVLLAAVAGLDTVSFPQMMISRPLVAAALGGALGGEFGAGLVVGVLLELLALDTLPVGATRYPEWGSASVVAGALAAQLMDRSAAAIPLAVLVGLVTALGGGWSMIQLRKLNAQWAHQRADALARGSERTVVGLQVAGLTADLARGAAVAAVAVLVARPLVAWAASAWRLDAGSSLAVTAAATATVAAGALWKRAAGAADARWYLAGGLALGGAVAWLR